MISLKSAALLYTKGYNEITTIMIQNETVDSVYAKTGGTVLVESEEPGIVNLIVRNTLFKNMRSSGGSALSLKDMGKVIIENCNFTQDENFSSPYAIQTSF